MAVRMDKLTYKAQEALQGAQELARQLGHPQIEAGHLLRTLLAQEDGLIRPLLKKLEIDPGNVTQGVDDRLSRLPKVSGEAQVYIWGKPALDQAQQTLRLTDVELAVESEAAFGLLGAAARAAVPHLQKALADKATIDLKPFATNAQKKIAAVIADFQKNENGVRVAAEITSLRLADIAFDSKTLRVIAEAAGAINVAVTALPGL